MKIRKLVNIYKETNKILVRRKIFQPQPQPACSLVAFLPLGLTAGRWLPLNLGENIPFLD